MRRRRSITPSGFHHGGNPIPAACIVGNLLVSGGVNPVDYVTGDVPSTIADQVALVFRNIGRILHAAGGTFDDVAKIDVYTDPANREVVNEVWVDSFPDPTSRPARKMTDRPLPKGFRIQCEFVAVIGAAASQGAGEIDVVSTGAEAPR